GWSWNSHVALVAAAGCTKTTGRPEPHASVNHRLPPGTARSATPGIEPVPAVSPQGARSAPRLAPTQGRETATPHPTRTDSQTKVPRRFRHAVPQRVHFLAEPLNGVRGPKRGANALVGIAEQGQIAARLRLHLGEVNRQHPPHPLQGRGMLPQHSFQLLAPA